MGGFYRVRNLVHEVILFDPGKRVIGDIVHYSFWGCSEGAAAHEAHETAFFQGLTTIVECTIGPETQGIISYIGPFDHIAKPVDPLLPLTLLPTFPFSNIKPIKVISCPRLHLKYNTNPLKGKKNI